MSEGEVLVRGRSVMVRDAGDPEGPAVVFFHGSPGSRLVVSAGEEVAKAAGVRVVTFDRPGYGRSDPAPFGLTSVAHDAEAIADSLGLGRIATMGISGGGPFALAAAAVMGDRVGRVGVVCGPGPYQQVPGALDSWSEEDVRLLSLLPDEPARVVEKALVDMEPLVALRDDEQALRGWIDATLGAEAAALPREIREDLLADTREALRQGAMGLAWDNVAWAGPWDFSLEEVRCRVHLWYGDRDPLAPPVHGEWLRDHLADAELVVYSGQGHVGLMRQLREMLQVLTA